MSTWGMTPGRREMLAAHGPGRFRGPLKYPSTFSDTTTKKGRDS